MVTKEMSCVRSGYGETWAMGLSKTRIRGTPHLGTVLQTCGGLIKGSTAKGERTSKYGRRMLTFHLAGRHIQLVRNKPAEASDQEAQEVYIPVKKGVCADKQDDYENEDQYQGLKTG